MSPNPETNFFLKIAIMEYQKGLCNIHSKVHTFLTTK